MGQSEFDPSMKARPAWNAGLMVGQVDVEASAKMDHPFFSW